MTISVVLDSNAFNFLFDRDIDLKEVLPPEEFSVFIPREVEIEIEAIPETGKDGVDKRAFKQFIKHTIANHSICTTAIFGFGEADQKDVPTVCGGFGHSNFQSNADRQYYARKETQEFIQGKSRRKSGLTKNQADAAVAACSLHSIILTCDEKLGPIADVAKIGGKVVYLSDDALALGSLAEILRQRYNQGKKMLFQGQISFGIL